MKSRARHTLAKNQLAKNTLVTLLSLVAFLGGLEGLAFVLGIEPLSLSRDPLVDFAPGSPLYVSSPTVPGMITTAPAKKKPFNTQTFLQKKPPGTKRLFCLGGSTTYGRPYNDNASFCNWLRQLLPVVDPYQKWEVINAGGISYASYRIAEMMDELVSYAPDVFVLYSGHNEFLEKRTYAQVADLPSGVRRAVGLLENSRGYSLLSRGYHYIRSTDSPRKDKPVLPGEVEAILDKSYGPNDYTRNDELAQEIISHYKKSVKRIIGKAKEASAEVIVVSTPSNLLDCSPFKSEYASKLSAAQKAQVHSWLQAAKQLLAEGKYRPGLRKLQAGYVLDPRQADLLFYLGKTEFQLGNYESAYDWLQKARDEDVCPLRSFSEAPHWLAQISRNTGALFLDFNQILENRSFKKNGHRILGKEDFYDHVHLTVENHKVLALSLLETMLQNGWLNPEPDWREKVSGVSEQILSKLDQRAYGLAMHNLAKVLNWAGKHEEAALAAESALVVVDDDLQALGSALYVGTAFQRKRNLDSAIHYYKLALRLDSNHLEANRLLGTALFLHHSYAEAGTYLDRALTLSGNSDPDLLLKRAQTWIFQKLPDQAVPYFQRRAQLAPLDARAQTDLAYALLQSYQIQQAEQVLREIVREFPRHPDGLAGLGEVMLIKGKRPEALTYLSEAARIDSANPRIRALLLRARKGKKP